TFEENSASSKNSVELQRMVALTAEGCSDTGFQSDEDCFENQNTSGNDNSLRSRVVQKRTRKGQTGGRAKRLKMRTIERHVKRCLERKYGTVYEFCREHKTTLNYLALVIAACVLNFRRALPLFMITVVAIFFVIWDHFMARYESQIAQLPSPGQRLLDSHWFWLKWVIWACLILGVIFWLVFDTTRLGQQQLLSFGGLLMYLILTFLFSKHPTKVYWRPVFWGIGLQFLLGLLILKTETGFMAFDWLRKQVLTFLEYTDAGATFVFGEKYKDHFFAFKVLPIVGFFSTVMSMLHYLGLMQWIIKKHSYLLDRESPLLVQPHLPYVTKSELHTIMTTGFSTIAGSVLGTFISFGVSSSHLLTASGASSCISLVANIAVNLIAFLALLSFANSALSWFGNMFDYPQLSFEVICSYIFMPFSFMMGVDWQDSFVVAKLIGYKTFFNKIVAYQKLSKLIHLKQEGGPNLWMVCSNICRFVLRQLPLMLSVALPISAGRLTSIALTSTSVDINCHHVLENAFNSGSVRNTTNVVSCCQSLLSGTVAKGPGEVIPEGNHSLYLKDCCNLLNPPTLNCSWVPNTF
ncbi:hypothetical protein EI555_021269, partial [Monodon monoceros]